MRKEFEIIVRSKEGKIIINQTFSQECMIAITSNEYPLELEGWKKSEQVWCNMSDKEKRRMLEHSTSYNNGNND